MNSKLILSIREAFGPAAVAVGAIVFLYSLPFVGLWLLSSVEDEILWRRLSPDGRREIQAVLRDQTAGLIAGDRFGVLRMRRAKGWRLGGWEDFGRFATADHDSSVVRGEWTGDRHLTISIDGPAIVSSLPASVMGVEIAFVRRGP